MVLSKNVIKCFCLIITMSFFLTPLNIEAQNKKKKKKKNDTETVVTPSKKDKEKSIKDLTKSSKKIDGLFTIYQDTITGSLQMVITEDQIGKEYIHFTQVADGVLDAGRFRGAYGGSKVFKVDKYFNKIEFITQNASFYFDPESPLSKSKSANVSEGNMASLKVEAHDKKEGLYLIKVDNLFLKETFSQIKNCGLSRQKVFGIKSLAKQIIDKSFNLARGRSCDDHAAVDNPVDKVITRFGDILFTAGHLPRFRPQFFFLFLEKLGADIPVYR